MNKLIKNPMFMFITGIVVASSSIVVASQFLARNIAYSPKDSAWKVDNVEAAIDDLVLMTSVPIGTIISYASSNVPYGYLECNGQEVSRTTYAKQFEKIMATYGEGDGSTTFNVPDLREEFLRGTWTNSHTNQGNGANVGVHQNGTIFSRFQMYNGSLFSSGTSNISNSDYADYVTRGSTYGSVKLSSESASDQVVSITSRPTNTSVLFCIKY